MGRVRSILSLFANEAAWSVEKPHSGKNETLLKFFRSLDPPPPFLTFASPIDLLRLAEPGLSLFSSFIDTFPLHFLLQLHNTFSPSFAGISQRDLDRFEVENKTKGDARRWLQKAGLWDPCEVERGAAEKVEGGVISR